MHTNMDKIGALWGKSLYLPFTYRKESTFLATYRDRYSSFHDKLDVDGRNTARPPNVPCLGTEFDKLVSVSRAVKLHGVPPHCSLVITYLVLVWLSPHCEHAFQADHTEYLQSTTVAPRHARDSCIAGQDPPQLALVIRDLDLCWEPEIPHFWALHGDQDDHELTRQSVGWQLRRRRLHQDWVRFMLLKTITNTAITLKILWDILTWFFSILY